MVGYYQKIKIKARFEKEARHFLGFLQQVGRRHSRLAVIKYRYLGRGYYYLGINGGSETVDALLQEMIINRGLYYYGCSILNRHAIIKYVILPIFRELIDDRFQNSQSRFLRKHVLGKYSQIQHVPTEARNEYGNKLESLFRKWDLKALSTKDYIISTDALLNQFLLEKTKHKRGQWSPNFYQLVESTANTYIMDPDTQCSFKKVHKIRTGALHRLEDHKQSEELHLASASLLNYFRFLDDYEESQKRKTIKLRGKRYKRIKYGDEKCIDEKGNPYLDDKGKPIDWPKECEKRHCHDCGIRRGQYHVEGCDAEVCPKCGGQYISFDCGIPSDS